MAPEYQTFVACAIVVLTVVIAAVMWRRRSGRDVPAACHGCERLKAAKRRADAHSRSM